MSFLTALPEALQAAAAQLQGLGTTFEAQSSAIAAPTTGLAPAAADEVSALQAGIFSTYGNLYQQISGQATAIQQQIAQNLGLSGGSYANAEATNAAAATNPWDQLVTAFQTLFGGNGTYGPSGNLSNVGNIGVGNYASACSDLLGLAGGGLLDTSAGAAPDISGLGAGLVGVNGAALDGGAAGGLAGAGGLGGAPVLAGVGASTSVGPLSVPPAWAPGEGVPVAAGTGPVQLAGWTGAAPGAAPAGTTVPAGMPAMATAGKSGGLGAPRYGLKPKVMPKPTTV